MIRNFLEQRKDSGKNQLVKQEILLQAKPSGVTEKNVLSNEGVEPLSQLLNNICKKKSTLFFYLTFS